MEPLKHLHRLLCGKSRECLHHGADIRKASSLGLFHPFIGISVAVEDDPLVLGGVFLDQVMDRHLEVFRLIQHIAGLREGLRHNGIKDYVGACDRVSGSHHTELKFIAGKCKWRRTVPVCGVPGQLRQRPYAGLQLAALDTVSGLSCAHQLIDHVLQLLAQENGDNGRRRFVGAQTMVISRI